MPIQLTPGKPQLKAENPPHTDPAETPPVKRCKTCGEEKSVAEYAGCGVTADKLQPNCRPCHSAKMTAGWAKSTQKAASIASADSTPAMEDGASRGTMPLPMPESHQLLEGHFEVNKPGCFISLTLGGPVDHETLDILEAYVIRRRKRLSDRGE